MGSPSQATLLRWELVKREHEHRAEKEAWAMEKREILDELGAITAERDGLRIVCRITDAVLAKSARDRDE